MEVTDFYANEGKKVVVSIGGRSYARHAITTHFVQIGESYINLIEKYVKPIYQPGDILFSSEKIIALCQGGSSRRKRSDPASGPESCPVSSAGRRRAPGWVCPRKCSLPSIIAAWVKFFWRRAAQVLTRLEESAALFTECWAVKSGGWTDSTERISRRMNTWGSAFPVSLSESVTKSAKKRGWRW